MVRFANKCGQNYIRSQTEIPDNQPHDLHTKFLNKTGFQKSFFQSRDKTLLIVTLKSSARNYIYTDVQRSSCGFQDPEVCGQKSIPNTGDMQRLKLT